MINWNLFREMENLRREMDQLFSGTGTGPLSESAFLPGLGTRRYPRINVREDADNYYLEALLPGVDGKHLDMNVVGSTLTLAGERAELDDNHGKTWHRRERGAGKFLRSIELPGEIDSAKVSAEYKDGVLNVVMPKSEAAKPKRIEVKVK